MNIIHIYIHIFYVQRGSVYIQIYCTVYNDRSLFFDDIELTSLLVGRFGECYTVKVQRDIIWPLNMVIFRENSL